MKTQCQDCGGFNHKTAQCPETQAGKPKICLKCSGTDIHTTRTKKCSLILNQNNLFQYEGFKEAIDDLNRVNQGEQDSEDESITQNNNHYHELLRRVEQLENRDKSREREIEELKKANNNVIDTVNKHTDELTNENKIVKIVTLNCNGANNNKVLIRILAEEYDIVYLQKT